MSKVIEIAEEIERLVEEAEGLQAPFAKLNMSNEYRELLVSANSAGLLHMASRILKLVEAVEGAHFTIDAADIAPDADCSITIARTT
jgi:hypothetical protein